MSKTYRVENDRMILEATSHAGEMTSLFDKKNNRELFYQADQGWSGRNPSLFPMVGKTWKDGSYEIDGKTYSMKNHGIIRYEEMEGRTEGNSIVFTLESNEETRKQYPFDFSFEMRQTLLDDGVKVSYSITNTGKEDMPFSFGLHPAFITSQNESEKFEDFSIQFSPASDAVQILFFPDLSPVKREKTRLDTWQLSRADLEKYATLVFEDFKAEDAALFYKDEPRLRMHFENYPYLALWSCETPSDYICIEPWFGHSDFEKTECAFAEREGTQILAPGKTFEASYTVEAL